eukprot:29502-Pelagococcus_subviridis.AAC.1
MSGIVCGPTDARDVAARHKMAVVGGRRRAGEFRCFLNARVVRVHEYARSDCSRIRASETQSKIATSAHPRRRSLLPTPAWILSQPTNRY